MPTEYILFIRSDAVSMFRSLRGRERISLEKFFDSLEQNPFQRGDAIERDSAGRQIEVKFIEGLRLTYHADHAVAEVRVLRLQRIPRR